MPRFTLVTKLDPADGHVVKSIECRDQAHVDSELARVLPDYPDAFIVKDEATADVAQWKCDPATKTIIDRIKRPKPTRDMAILRSKRNALLASSDWTQGNDSPLDNEAKAEWAIYRQELRDLPASTEDPADPTWPEAPE
jgi:hypothetical protein